MINPRGLGPRHTSPKLVKLKAFLLRHKVDLLGISETNVDWRLMDTRSTLWGRTEGWFEARKFALAHNREAPRDNRCQAGGTAMMAINRMAYCVKKCGHDSRNLGRWSWFLLRGQNGIVTRVVTVYGLCRPTSDPEDKTAYHVQRRVLESQNIHTSPRDLFWTDLIADIQKWRNDGEQLIIGGDWNLPIAQVNKKFEGLGLLKSVTSTHGLEKAPPTFNRGRNTIDGIYVSASLQSSRCGFLPFNKGPTADHRIVWVDIAMDNVLGFQMDSLPQPLARRLQLRDPRITLRYQTLLDEYCREHNLYERSDKVMKELVYPLPKCLQKEAFRIDQLRTQGMILAEKRCRKLRKGVYAWSPTFQKALDSVRFWTMVKERRAGTKIDTKRLLRMIYRGYMNPEHLTDEEVGLKVDEAWAHYRHVKLNSIKYRMDFLEELSKALAAAHNIKASSALRLLMHREEVRRIARAIKFTMKKLFQEGTFRVLVPIGNNQYKEITDRKSLESALIRENIRKYHRTESYCPLLLGKLFQDIGVLADGPAVQDIIDGTYVPPPGTNKGTRAYLRHMKKVPLSESTIERASRSNVDEFCFEWNRVREHTSSHGSLHYGHFKVGCRHQDLKLLHFNMAEIGMISGYYQPRHAEGVDVMLPKDPEDARVHRQRTIFLFDAELNMNQRRIGKSGLAAEITNGSFLDEQYSCPNRSALDHVVNKKLSFDYFNLIRRPYGLTSCDLAGNYDRIVHNAAILALMRAGVPYPRLRGMFQTLQDMVKRVKTVYGVSDATYGGSKPDWPHFIKQQGVFQGNAAGPAIWAIISSTVFAILREEGYGVDFILSISAEVYKLGGFAFVDDSDLLQGGETTLEVSKKMQEALVWWEEIMHTTGQAMEPSKSWWYLIDYVWKNGKWSVVDGDTKDDLIAHDSDGVAVSLTRLLASQARKMLGVYMSPDGNQSEEMKYLNEKVMKWSECIRTGHLRSVETWVALSTCIWKTVLYPLPVTNFSDAELRTLVAPIVDAAFSRMGVNPSFPVALRYGPPCLGGLGLVDPYFHQGASKVQYLVEHPWKRTPTGKLLQCNMESLSIESGLFGSPLNHPFPVIRKYLSFDSWVLSAWQFMHENKIQITHLPFPTLSAKREGDFSIMCYLSRIPGIKSDALRKINACRLFLRVVSVSDITDTTGYTILPTCYNNNRRPHPTTHRTCNDFLWPAQPPPPRSYWAIWRSELIHSISDTRGNLIRPLGKWSPSELQRETYRRNWDWFVSLDSSLLAQHLWFRDGEQWYQHARISHRSRRHRFFTLTRTLIEADHQSFLNQTLHRATVEHDTNRLVVKHFHLYSTSPQVNHTEGCTTDDRLTIRDRLNHALSSRREFSWMMDTFECSADLEEFLHDFEMGNVACVSDGSYQLSVRLGSASWSLENRAGTQYIKGGCIVPGGPDDQSAYRSELIGILGITYFCWGLCQISSPRTGCEILVGCDGFSALQRSVLSDPTSLSSRHKSFDVVAAIKGYWRDMPCESFPVYVRGHADEDTPYQRLTRLELMNIDMDRRAKDLLTDAILHSVDPPDPSYQFGLPQVFVGDRPIVSELAKSIITIISKERALQFWAHNLSLTAYSLRSIHWHAFERGMTSLPRHKRFLISQWLCRQLLHLYRAFKKKNKKPSLQCPFCSDCSEETIHHFLRCRKTRKANLLHVDSLYQWLVDNETEPFLSSSIRDLIKDWIRFGYVTPSTRNSFPDCLLLQEDIGWFAFIQGLQHLSLSSHQEAFFNSRNSRRTGVVWHKKFLHELWNTLYSIYSERKQIISGSRPDIEEDDDAVLHLRRISVIELRRGQRDLPNFYRSYFVHSETALRNLRLRDLYGWLKTIRRGRERHEPHVSDPVDVFSPEGQFREWLDP